MVDVKTPERKKPLIIFYYLGALFYDVLVMSSLLIGLTSVCLVFRKGVAIAPGTLWFQCLLTAVIYLYYAFSCLNGGQTVGMRAWRLKLVSKHATLSHKQVAKRFLLFLPLLVLSPLMLQGPLTVLNRYSRCEMIIV